MSFLRSFASLPENKVTLKINVLSHSYLSDCVVSNMHRKLLGNCLLESPRLQKGK